jgi:hypothetical protein
MSGNIAFFGVSWVADLSGSQTFIKYWVQANIHFYIKFVTFNISVSLDREQATFFNPLKPSGNYVYQLLEQPVSLHFIFMGLV